jgi:hypothetical protein
MGRNRYYQIADWKDRSFSFQTAGVVDDHHTQRWAEPFVSGRPGNGSRWIPDLATRRNHRIIRASFGNKFGERDGKPGSGFDKFACRFQIRDEMLPVAISTAALQVTGHGWRLEQFKKNRSRSGRRYFGSAERRPTKNGRPKIGRARLRRATKAGPNKICVGMPGNS